VGFYVATQEGRFALLGGNQGDRVTVLSPLTACWVIAGPREHIAMNDEHAV